MINFGSKTLESGPWDDWAERIIFSVPSYLSKEGSPTSGGRQRKVRDLSVLVRSVWGRECCIVQKAEKPFEAVDPNGTPVLGVKARSDIYGDPVFGYRTQKLLRPKDALIYLGGEDAWPFFVRGAKAFHVGVWWDGPGSALTKWLTGLRTKALFETSRSVLCCDTNVINWLRAQAGRYQSAANRAVYLPNCVDLATLNRNRNCHPHRPLRILFARRYSYKRGAQLALDAIEILVRRGVDVRLVASTPRTQDGSKDIMRGAKERGIAEFVETQSNDLNTIYSLYASVDVALVPTLWSEGTSYACVEAIAAGVPVVTTTVGGLPNIVLPNFNGYVEPPNAMAVASAIEKYTNNETWLTHHENCGRMREALSSERWKNECLKWLKN